VMDWQSLSRDSERAVTFGTTRETSDPTFSRFDTIPACDRHTDGHTTTAYTALA